jgi:enoyl-CoA hydratase/carnithine racemase
VSNEGVELAAGFSGEFVRIELDGPVATIRLERPKMNALSIQLQAELGAAAVAVAGSPGIRAVIIYGGSRIFAAGADILEMAEMSAGQMAAQAVRLQDAFTALARIPKPTIAAVTGFALGGGLELALTADFRVLGDNARVGQPEILLGVIPGAGGTQRLARLIGPAKAKELIYSGRHVRADEALSLGIADKVVPVGDPDNPESVYAAALAWARQYADGPATALAAAKAAVDDGLAMGLAEGLRLESALFAGLFGTDDRTVGMRSFLKEGPGHARFTGH